METMKPEQPDDVTLSQAYQALPQPEPSAALDAAILAAARAAVQPTAEVIAFPRRRRNWTAPLGLAASLVIAVGVGWQLQQSGESQLSKTSEADLSLPAPASFPAAAAPAAEGAPAVSTSPESDAQPAPKAQADRRAAANIAPPTEAKAAPSAQAERKPASPAFSAMPAPPVVAPLTAPAAPPAPPPPPAFVAPPAPAPAPAPLIQAPERAEQAAAAKPAAPATAGRAAESVTVTGSAIKRKDLPGTQAEPAAAPLERAKSSEEGRPQLRQKLAPPAAADKTEQAETETERTLQEVRSLLAAGQDSAASTLLQRLHEQKPDYPIPPELRSLLAPPARER